MNVNEIKVGDVIKVTVAGRKIGRTYEVLDVVAVYDWAVVVQVPYSKKMYAEMNWVKRVAITEFDAVEKVAA